MITSDLTVLLGLTLVRWFRPADTLHRRSISFGKNLNIIPIRRISYELLNKHMLSNVSSLTARKPDEVNEKLEFSNAMPLLL